MDLTPTDDSLAIAGEFVYRLGLTEVQTGVNYGVCKRKGDAIQPLS